MTTDIQKSYESVFILGAGASCDFGFPTGEELLRDVDRLCEACLIFADNWERYYEPNNYTREKDGLLHFADCLFVYFGRAPDLLRAYAQRLRNGLPLSKSIDNFLYDQEDHHEFTSFGKILIGAALLKAEASGLHDASNRLGQKINPWRFILNDKLDFFALRETWFPTFFREIRTDNGKESGGVEALKSRLSKIAIISFNYERSFEYLFQEALKVYHAHLRESDIREIMDCITIIHPYGTLGTLEELPFATDFLSVQNWSVFKDRIKIFMEDGDIKTQKKAKLIVQKAERLIFMGFGFHEQNMRFLGLGEWDSAPHKLNRIYATGLGLSNYQREKRAIKLSNLIQVEALARVHYFQEHEISEALDDDFRDEVLKRLVRLESSNCKDLLEEYADDIFGDLVSTFWSKPSDFQSE